MPSISIRMSHPKYIIAIITGIIAIVAVSFYICRRDSSCRFTQAEEGIIYENPDSLHFRNLEREFLQMNQVQLLHRKRFAEEALEKLNLEIKSDSLNPEEAHEALITISNTRHELKLIDKCLHKSLTP